MQYSRHFIFGDAFHLTSIAEVWIEKKLKRPMVSKVAAVNKPSGRFVRDGSLILSKPIS